MKSIPLLYRILIVVVVLVVSVTLIFVDLSSLKNPQFKKTTNVNLGLDLRGGSFLVMQVQTGEAVREETQNVAGRIDRDLREKKVFRSDFDGQTNPDGSPVQGATRLRAYRGPSPRVRNRGAP